MGKTLSDADIDFGTGLGLFLGGFLTIFFLIVFRFSILFGGLILIMFGEIYWLKALYGLHSQRRGEANQ